MTLPPDATDEAEGGVAEFLETLRQSLMRYGINLDVQRVEDGLRYAVVINGRRCVVLEDADDSDWLGATVRPLAVVNTLLDEAQLPAGCTCSTPAATTGITLLLPASVVSALIESGLFGPAEIPLRPEQPKIHRLS